MFTYLCATLCNSRMNTFLFFSDGVVSHYPVAYIPTTDIVDTNGAGDAFIGGKILFLTHKQNNNNYFYIYFVFFSVSGFIGKYILGCKLDECVKTGIKLGSYIVTQSGVTKDSSFCIS